jgi:phage-related protein
MRFTAAALILVPIVVVACSQARTERLDERTFRIEGPEVPGGSDVPNRRIAEQVCPHGYRVVDSKRYKADPQSQPQTDWTVRCL